MFVIKHLFILFIVGFITRQSTFVFSQPKQWLHIYLYQSEQGNLCYQYPLSLAAAYSFSDQGCYQISDSTSASFYNIGDYNYLTIHDKPDCTGTNMTFNQPQAEYCDYYPNMNGYSSGFKLYSTNYPLLPIPGFVYFEQHIRGKGSCSESTYYSMKYAVKDVGYCTMTFDDKYSIISKPQTSGNQPYFDITMYKDSCQNLGSGGSGKTYRAYSGCRVNGTEPSFFNYYRVPEFNYTPIVDQQIDTISVVMNTTWEVNYLLYNVSITGFPELGNILCKRNTTCVFSSSRFEGKSISLNFNFQNGPVDLELYYPPSNKLVDIQMFQRSILEPIIIESFFTRNVTFSFKKLYGIPSTDIFNITLDSIDKIPISYCSINETIKCVFTLSNIYSLVPGSHHTFTISVASQNSKFISNTIQSSFTLYKLLEVPVISFNQTKGDLFINISAQYGIPNITSYELYLNGTKVENCTLDSNENIFLCVIKDIIPTTDYNFRFIAYNDNETTESTKTWRTWANPTYVDLKADPGMHHVYLYWNESLGGQPNHTRYHVYFTYGRSEWKLIPECQNLVTLSCNKTDLVSSTKYLFRVTIDNDAFQNIYSYINVTTLFDPTRICDGDFNICNGHGQCINGRCECSTGWDGVLCELRKPIGVNVTVTPNESSPSLVVNVDGVTYDYTVSMVEEKAFGVAVSKLNLTNLDWNLTYSLEHINHPENDSPLLLKNWRYVYPKLANGTSGDNSTNSQPIKSILIIFSQYVAINETLGDTFPGEFAGEEFQVKIGAIKYTIELVHWSFESPLNYIDVSSLISAPLDQCGRSSDSSEIKQGSDSSTITIGSGNLVMGRLLNRALIDDIPMRMVYSTQLVNKKTLLTSTVPYFEKDAAIDPDFSLMLKTDKDGNIQRDPCDTGSSKADSMKIIIGVVVGFVGLVAIVVATIVTVRQVRRNRKEKRIMASRLRKLQLGGNSNASPTPAPTATPTASTPESTAAATTVK